MDLNSKFLSIELLAHFEESRERLASRDSSVVEEEFPDEAEQDDEECEG